MITAFSKEQSLSYLSEIHLRNFMLHWDAVIVASQIGLWLFFRLDLSASWKVKYIFHSRLACINFLWFLPFWFVVGKLGIWLWTFTHKPVKVFGLVKNTFCIVHAHESSLFESLDLGFLKFDKLIINHIKTTNDFQSW